MSCLVTWLLKTKLIHRGPSRTADQGELATPIGSTGGAAGGYTRRPQPPVREGDRPQKTSVTIVGQYKGREYRSPLLDLSWTARLWEGKVDLVGEVNHRLSCPGDRPL